jgi:hypothetical protein
MGKYAAIREHEIATMRIELIGSSPLIWRELEVPTSITLKTLHEVIQAAMGWGGMHPWEFVIMGNYYGLVLDEDYRDEPVIDALKKNLYDVLGLTGTIIEYAYDFADDWRVRLIFSNLRKADPTVRYPRYVSGELAARL